MAHNVAVFELFGGREATAGAWRRTPDEPVTFEVPLTEGSGFSDPVPQGIIPLSCFDPIGGPDVGIAPYSNFTGTILTDGPSNVGAITGPQQTDLCWLIEGAHEANAGVQPWQQVGRVNATLEHGRNAGPLQAQLAGDAGTAARGGNALVSIQGTIQYAYPASNPYQSLAHICVLEEEPPNTVADGSEAVTSILRALQHAPVQQNLGNDAGGTPVIVQDCGFTALAPEAAVYVDPADFPGNGSDQIPQSVTNNTANHFNFHPAVFIRRPMFFRAVQRRFRDGVDIATAAMFQPIKIVEVDAPPVDSNWLICVEGVWQMVNISHGALDLRRPRDIWNQIWVPLIRGDSSVQNAPVLRALNSQVNASGPGSIELRLSFLEYARCLPLPGTEVPQTDASQQ